jgi:hypothetical protein
VILFFDRSVGTTIPTILRNYGRRLRLEVRVEFHDQNFPQDEHDDVWLPEVGLWGWTVIGKDYSYHLRGPEISAIKQYGIGCFYLWGTHAHNWEVLRCFARAFDRIVAAEATAPKPFIFRVTRMGLLIPNL